MIDDIDIPAFCIMTAADRALAWERNPPKPYAIQEEQREVIRLRLEQDRQKTYERIHTMKTKRKERDEGPQDTVGMRWCTRTNRWVAGELVVIKSQTVHVPSRKKAPAKRQRKTT